MPSMRTLLLGTTALFATLSAALALAPWSILWLFGLPDDPSAMFMSRRASLLFLGWGTALFGMRNVEDPTIVRALALGLAITTLGLGALGLGEFARGYAGPGILPAVASEIVLGALFLMHARRRVS